MSDRTLIIDDADKVPPSPPGRHPHAPISGADFERARRHRGLPPQVVMTLVVAALAVGGYVLWRVHTFLDAFFFRHPWIGPAVFWVLTLAVVVVIVAGAGAVAARLVGWGLAGAVIRSRLGVPVNVADVLRTPYLIAEGQAITLELERARYSQFPSVSTLSGYKPPEVIQPPPEQQALLPAPPPLDPTQSELEHLISIGHMRRSGHSVLIGHEAATEPGARYGRPHYLDLRAKPVIAVAGAQQTGKSSAVRSILAQLAIQPGEAPGIVICDPHGQVAAKSLAVSCGPLAQSWLWQPAIEPTAILDSVRRVRAIGDARLAGRDTSSHMIVLVIDEFTALMDQKGEQAAELARHVRSFGFQYAKEPANIRLILIGQSWHADLTGGTAMRHAIQAALVHAVRRQEAAYLLPLEEAKRAEQLRPQTGEALYKPHWAEAAITLRVPWVATDHLKAVADQVRVPAPVVLPAAQSDPRQLAIAKLRQRVAPLALEEKIRLIHQLAAERGATRTGYRWTTDELQQISGLRNQVVCDIAAAARRAELKVAA